MKVKPSCKTKTNVSEKWFDQECLTNKLSLRRSLQTYRNNRTEENKMHYHQMRKTYKNLLKRKKSFFNENRVTNLCNNINNPNTFWKEIKKITSTTKAKRKKCLVGVSRPTLTKPGRP